MAETKTRTMIHPARGSATAPRELNMQRLLNALGGPSELSTAEVAAAFDELCRLVESLALAKKDYCFAINWATSARQLWKQGELGAARLFQLDLVCKKFDLRDHSSTPYK